MGNNSLSEVEQDRVVLWDQNIEYENNTALIETLELKQSKEPPPWEVLRILTIPLNYLLYLNYGAYSKFFFLNHISLKRFWEKTIVLSENANKVIKSLIIESMLIMLLLPLLRSPNSCIAIPATVFVKLQRIVLIGLV